MKKALAQILIAAAMMEGSESKYDNRTAVNRQILSKAGTMSRKAWKKRKSRLRMAKKSRQINRI